MVFDDPYFEELDFQPEEPEEEEDPLHPPWRRPLLIVVAAITTIAMAAVPLYNIFDQGRPVAGNGLEVCGFDYCVVQEAAIAAGLNEEMSRLANTFLSDEEARELADTLLDQLGEPNVSLIVVDRLDGALKGQYDSSNRTILVERPVRAWIVVHEVAHARAQGHGTEFQRVLFELTRWIDEESPLE